MAKKEVTPEPHFKPLVEIYFKFCERKFNARPSFDGSIPRDFKNLIYALRKRSEENNFEWNESCASQTLNHFLEVAISDPWLAQNFLIRTLFTQKDKIFFKIASNGKFNTTKQSTGATVNTPSAFSKIDQLFSSHVK